VLAQAGGGVSRGLTTAVCTGIPVAGIDLLSRAGRAAASRAGWIAPDRALDDGEFRVDLGGGAPDQAVSDGWRPLDLSRLQAAASAMAVEPVRVYFLKECFGVNIPPNHPDDEALLRVPTIALCYPWCGSAGR
jgi:hypothetical protein